MQLSVVTTLYQSAAHLIEFVDRVRKIAEPLGIEYEVVLVNDGSPDQSLAIALDLVVSDSRIRVVDLSRRYGHYEAMLAGLRCARGQFVFLIDCDLDEPPELLPSLWSALRANGDADMAVAVQAVRRGRSLTDWCGDLYYRMLEAQTGLEIPRNNMVARVMTPRYVAALIAAGERPVSFDALSARVGCRHVAVQAEKAARRGTTYSFSRRAAIFVDTWLAYGSLSSSAFMALAIAVGGAGAVALLVDSRLVAPVLVVAAVAGLAGIALICRYLSLVLEEVRHRPAQVRRIYPDA